MAEVNIPKIKSDEVLVRMVYSGKLAAMDTLIDRYYSLCFGICMAVLKDYDDASDACQNCFVNVFKNIDKFRGDGNFRSWVLTIARNESFSVLRQRKNRRENVYEEMKPALRSREDVPREVFLRIESSRVREVVETLPDKQRLAIKLRIDEGLSFKEIGQIIGSSEGSSRVNYHHGIGKLKELLGA